MIDNEVEKNLVKRVNFAEAATTFVVFPCLLISIVMTLFTLQLFWFMIFIINAFSLAMNLLTIKALKSDIEIYRSLNRREKIKQLYGEHNEDI